jgi:tetratricopeptide (TPR) repeat protein
MDLSIVPLYPRSSSESVDPLLAEGELLLLGGHFDDALARFKEAEALCRPEDSLYYREALALFEFGCAEKHKGALAKACKKFKQATELNPLHLEAWQAWGGALLALGHQTGALSFFEKAEQTLAHAIALLEKQAAAPSADLYWDYALCWRGLAAHSSEAMDLQCATTAFQKAAAIEQRLPAEFWIDFGGILLASSVKMRDRRPLLRAINCLKFALSIDKRSAGAWEALGEAFALLYQQTHEEDHFVQANEAFEQATTLHPQDEDLWKDWAELLISSSRKNRDLKRLRAALEKCHAAYVRNSLNPLILATWAEALALLGQMSERLDLLCEAQNKILEAIELTDQEPRLWHAWGLCLSSFAVYFSELDYYYQAIEKFQSGLSIDRSVSYLWEALAITYATVGHLEADPAILTTCFKFFQKALALKPSSTLIVQQAIALSRMGELTDQSSCFENALQQFELAFSMQKNAIYLYPDWLFQYGCTLDLLGDYHDSERYYARAIDIFTHVLMIDPDFPRIHHRLAQVYGHLGELLGEIESFYRSIHHLRLALKKECEDEQIILDWAIVLVSIAQHTALASEAESIYADAEQKMVLAAKLGNPQAYYHLSCLYSLTGQYDQSFHFLLKAQEFKVLPMMEELLQDEWLEGLRTTSHFRSFISRFDNRQET